MVETLTIELATPMRERLSERAVAHGRTVEQEARELLAAALNDRPTPREPMGDAFRRLFRDNPLPDDVLKPSWRSSPITDFEE